MVSSKRHSFTLVELLVSLAIITLLIGLLLPGLSYAKKSAEQIRCLNKIKESAREIILERGNNQGWPDRAFRKRYIPENIMSLEERSYYVYDLYNCPTNNDRLEVPRDYVYQPEFIYTLYRYDYNVDIYLHNPQLPLLFENGPWHVKDKINWAMSDGSVKSTSEEIVYYP